MNLQNIVLKAKDGDMHSKEYIIEKFKPMVIKNATRTYIKGYDLQDLIQYGYEAILKAIMKYDESKNDNFVGYVCIVVRNAYYDLIKCKAKERYESSLNIKTVDGDEIQDFIVMDYNLEEEYNKKESIENLKRKLKLLSKEDRKFILYIFEEGYGSLKNYAKENNLDYGLCRRRKDKIIRKLRSLV